jgi:hypothetical protein
MTWLSNNQLVIQYHKDEIVEKYTKESHYKIIIFFFYMNQSNKFLFIII